MAEIYGYAYADDAADEENCLKSLGQFSIPEGNIYTDKRESTAESRPMYKRLIKRLHEGDTLYINSLNCLGDSYDAIREQWRDLTRSKCIDVIVLDIPLLDLKRGNDGMKIYVSDLVDEILSYVAVNERKKLKKRQAEAMETARKKGVHIGRPLADLPVNFEEKCREWKSGDITCSEAARECGMSRTSFRTRARMYFESTEDYREASNL